MVLSDATIIEEIEKGNLKVSPFDEKLLQAASIDIRLGRDFMTWIAGAGNPIIDPSGMSADSSINYERVICNKSHPFFYLYPSQFVLASSLETVSLPNDLIGRLDGRSSLGRIGLLVSPSSRHIAPGFEGQISLELMNMTNRPIKLVPGMRIAQLAFERLDRPTTRPYGSSELAGQYQRQRGPKPPVFTMLENLAAEQEATNE